MRRLREDAGACGLVICEHGEDEDGCNRLAPPTQDGPALCARHQQQAVQAARQGCGARPWQPASIGGAQAVHALPDGAVAGRKAWPEALCGGGPNRAWCTAAGSPPPWAATASATSTRMLRASRRGPRRRGVRRSGMTRAT
mgnify:CR=1 FL=1